ncbi:hypothetical protein ACHAWU_005114 [Discostella pseudostelligera]|uniref:Molybdopterin synthase sulfur carrier subunit n=1 Tax=Discostella pseudostelligera TaxID=259834 RepID=A0ABD3LZM4_9STRA
MSPSLSPSSSPSSSSTNVVVTITILFFASAREAVGGITSTTVELDINDANTKTLRTKLANLYPKLASFVQDEENITLALNEEYIPMGEVKNLKEGDTVALIPPISGG